MNRFRIEKKLSTSICLMVTVGLLGVGSLPAMAQADADDTMEEVTVTGSRIKRSSLDAPVPIMSLTEADLRQSGDIDLGRIIRELPTLYEGHSTENSQSQTQDSGSATLEMRNLGQDRTLVLIDGRRTVSNSFTHNVVSLDTIPNGFIERVDVITGGASAVYGSDAVTGVINIITRDEFEGFEVGARLGTSQEGDGEEYKFELTIGTNFDDDRGNLLVNYTYDEGDAIRIKDRDWSSQALDIDGDISLSSSAPGGRFLGRDWYFDSDTNQLMQNFSTSANGFNARQDNRTMRIPKERNLLAAKIRYNLTDNTTAFFHTQYAHIYTMSEREPDTANSGSTSLNAEIPLNNPFIPPQILAQAIADGDSGISFRRRWMEVGQRHRGGNRDLTRTWIGLEGSFNDNWEWTTFFGYHQFRSAQNRVGDLVVPKFADAIDVEPDPDNPGEFRCVSARSRIGGCVPINIFGVGAVTPEAANWVIYQDSMHGENTESQAAFYVTGDVFEMPAGPLSVAGGIEYRDVTSKTIWDPIAKGGLGTLSQQVDQFGTFDVFEAYVEAIIPVFEGFDIEAAVRSASYDQPTVDQTSTFRIGFSWQAIDSIRFRTMFATAERAPNIIELFSAGIGAVGPNNDPCDGVTLTSPGVVDDNCRSVASVLANIQANGSFLRDTESFISHPRAGNLALIEESAETLTVGFVFTPTAIDGLSISIDYYDIEIEDAIDAVGHQDVLDLCFEDPNFDPNNAFCSQVFREDTSGELFLIKRTNINVNTLFAKGVDTTLNYDFELGFMPGDFTFNLHHSYVDTLEEDFNAPQGPTTEVFLGQIPFPENRARAALRWQRDDWYAHWKTTFWGEVIDGAVLEDGSILSLSGQWKHDLYVSHEMGWPGENNSTMYIGINNVFDEDPPFLGTGAEFGGTVPTHSSWDRAGRYFYVGFDTAF